MTEITAAHRTVAASPSARLGDRLRLLRVAAGLTQTELAGDRFSKEYVSQIERGKTRPTAETVAWLAKRLDVDPAFLSSGVSTDERGRVEALLTRAEALSSRTSTRRRSRPTRRCAPPSLRRTRASSTSAPASGEAWARMQEGDVRTAIDLLNAARALAEGSIFSDVDRADIVFKLGVCRYKLSSISTAVALLDEALALAERSEMPCDGLRSDIYTGAPAVTGGSVTSRPRARTSSTRSSSHRASTTAARWPTPISRRRSSPSGRATGCSRATTRSARRTSSRSSTTSARSAGC